MKDIGGLPYGVSHIGRSFRTVELPVKSDKATARAGCPTRGRAVFIAHRCPEIRKGAAIESRYPVKHPSRYRSVAITLSAKDPDQCRRLYR